MNKIINQLGVSMEKDQEVQLLWNKSENAFGVILKSGITANETTIGAMDISELNNLGFKNIPYEIFLNDGMSGMSFNYKGKKIKINIPFAESTKLEQNILHGKPMIPVSIKTDSLKLFP